MTRREALLMMIENYYTRPEAAHFLKQKYPRIKLLHEAYSILDGGPVNFPQELAENVKLDDGLDLHGQ